MVENRMSLLSGSLLWFGAAISIAEILTGALLAPLGFGLGMTAIIVGHLIGCMLFFFAGLIGAKSNMSSMQSVGLSFGRYGSVFFSVLNVLQLVGWTAVMIINGANAFGQTINAKLGFMNNIPWCILIGLLIIVWIVAGLKNIGKLSVVAVGTLFVLTAILGITVFRSGEFAITTEMMSFGLALELSIAMPISWLPLISDYTKHSDKPVGFTFISTASYFIGSCFMYIIGLGAAIFAGTSDVVQILMSAGLGISAMLIVILSTVTTTFLDVYSAGISIVNINRKLNDKLVAIIVCIIGTLMAMFIPIGQYENFLYLIGSVFVPMVTILITDYFILKNRDNTRRKLNFVNAFLWVIGFIIYRIFLGIETIIGSTIPVVVIVMLLCIVINKFVNRQTIKEA
ncbi:MAG: putative hydroxymethylpyrimidine transporter CytX [Desulfitobacteriaceae bacterium]|nr:putative hydroxymethylpyrimidine transporter CytX [Desulfitobacteriaceae bacterium]MDD4345678.1 putative hydroxymethylpyrimidine transporter CytX [Desulfitobacteriaceae bacterium]MDD4400510.1 putative hydroxymethylpyrimidine transporter CytX [Desulfitobacteriaceae bacterium]